MISATTEGLRLECTFGKIELLSVPDLYICQGKIARIGDVRKVIKVFGEHLKTLTDDEVTEVYIQDDENLKKIPQELHKHFPNLAAFYVFYTGIEEISHEDFQYLKKLKKLYLEYNKIQTINSDAFIGNLALTHILIGHNPITSVAFGVFDHLTELKLLKISNATCFSDNDGTNIPQIILQIKVHCKPTSVMSVKNNEKYSQPKKIVFRTFHIANMPMKGAETVERVVFDHLKSNFETVQDQQEPHKRTKNKLHTNEVPQEAPQTVNGQDENNEHKLV